MMNLEII